MTSAHRIEAVLTEDGKLLLDHLPFRAGQKVDVIILSAAVPAVPPTDFPLRGMVLRYDDPTIPVAEEEWSALQ